jgi:hypothetical protein
VAVILLPLVVAGLEEVDGLLHLGPKHVGARDSDEEDEAKRDDGGDRGEWK